jgi:hypothetical protein
VKSHTRTIPINTAKNTQAVHTLVFNPLNKHAVMTAAIAIVCDNMNHQDTRTWTKRTERTVENSYSPTSYPSERAVGEKYAYCTMKYITADCVKL